MKETMMNSDCDIHDLLYDAIENCDCTELLQRFNLNVLNQKHLDYIYEKIRREYIFVEFLNSDDLAQEGNLFSNALHVLWALINDLNINNDALSLDLAKSMLPVITDEHCCIKNMKTALHIFNTTITKPNVVNYIVTDDTLEGFLQILGRKVSSVGDYECQAAFIEALCRIASEENSLYWINIWFPEPTARSMFSSIKPEKFECSMRQLLNYINRNDPERRVFSFIAQSVAFGSFQLKKPKECDMWIDFNYDSQSISFYCSECSLQYFENSTSEHPEMWETIVIDYSSLAGFSIKVKKGEKKIEVTLLLNFPCYSLSTLSNATHPEFTKNKVTIVFWDLLDIYPHLEEIYGKDKHLTQLPEENATKLSPSKDVDIMNETRDVLSNEYSSQRKVSNLTSPIRIDVCESEIQSNEYSSQRKVSNVTSPICIDVCENEVLSKEYPSQRKISNLTSPICIDACKNEVLSNGHLSQRKVSNLTSPICIDVCENEDFIPESDVNQSFSIFKKVSESTEKIPIISKDVRNERSRKISESSELIEVDLSMSNIDKSSNMLHKSQEKLTETIRKSSTKVMKENKGETAVLKTVGKKKRRKMKRFQSKESYALADTTNLISNLEKNCREDLIDEDFKVSGKNFCKSEGKKPLSPRAPCGRKNYKEDSIDEDFKVIHKSGEKRLFSSKTPSKGVCKTEIPTVISNEFFKDVKKTDLENTFERKESDCLSNKKDEKIHKENKDRSYSPTLEKNLRKGESKKKRIKKVGKNQDKESLYALTNTSNLFKDVEKNREEELVDDDFKLTCKSNEKKPFCPMTHLNGGCKIDIPVSISNECPKDAERKAEVNKEIADSLHSPSVIEESLNVETLFPNNVPVEDSNYDNNFTFLAQPEDTLKYKENKKVEDLNDENPENFNQLMKQTKRIDSKNDAVISKTRPNLLSENDNELLETNLKSSNNIESQKICDKAQNRASTSSKETDYSETSSKFQRKKVRLYNLESAPVFDVPRISSSFDASQENAPCKSNLPEPDKGYISENSDKPFELRNKRKTESDGKKNCAERKRRKSSDHNELLTRGHSIHLFDDFPVSEEDFQEHTFRDSYRRKRNISETLSAVHEQSVTRNREDEVFLNTEEKKPAKKQRKAALKAMKKTKEILDKKPEATHTLSVYDIVEDIDQTKKNSASTSKSLKRKQSKSDTDTHSSDVSWLKKRKSYLFESPKKNYSDWRKSVSKKKKLPVKVIPDTSVRKIADSKSSRKRKKESSKSDSNIDAKSFGFSALETYDLTVEKNDIINSHSVMKDLESQFCDIAKANVTEKNSAVNGLDSITEIDHPRKKFKNNCEISSTEKKKKDASTSKVLNTENKYYDPENEFNNEPEYDMIEHDNNGNTYENIAPSIELIECFEEENAVECEETKSKHTLKDVSQELVYRHPIDELAMSETRGKIMILQRFLKSVAEYSGKYKSKDSCKSSLHETISSSDLCPPHLSCKTFSDGIEIAKSNDENQVVLDSNLSEQCPNEEIIDNLEESENIVNEYEQSPMFSPRRRKKSSSEDFDKAQCLSFNHQVSEKETSMEPRTNDRNARATSMEARTASDDLSIHDQKRRKHLVKKIRKYLSGSENSSSKQEKFSKKSKPQERSTKDIRNRSFSSSVSHLTSTSMKDALKDKNWLQDITSLLSQNACNLSRKMLATVQICFAEFCFKMSTLRENLVKTAKIFELPLSQDEYKLKSLIKSCKIVRLEVEKSLVRMRSTGKEYFEAEERDYKRLRKKQMKANKKYLQNMQKIKRNSIAKLEQKVLYKSKYFLKKFLMHIDSA